jgi:aminoglycoside phosphotransferase (APT) family kinase protein
MGQNNSDEALAGGNMSSVWRIGSTVHREAGPWTPQVHRLLAHLHARGVSFVPQPLGMDDQGREVLTYLAGEAGSSPLAAPHRHDAVLTQAARMLRAIHDATIDLAGQGISGWRAPVRAPVEVICHGDFAPYNCVFVGAELVGVFDFDFAHPGPRVWDLAYALYRFVPLADPARTEGFGTPAEQARRMRLFCDAYGLADRSRVLEATRARVQFMVDFLLDGQAAGDTRRIANIAAGHLAVYQHDLAYIERHCALFEAALA